MSVDILDGWEPKDLGVDPVEYPDFRRDPLNGDAVQLEAIEFFSYCEKQVAAGRIPTGIGKMLIAWGVARVTGLRTVVLTATNGLLKQYMDKLEKYGAVAIKGKSNYQCGHYNQLNCRGGASMGCRYVGGGGCEYERHKDVAKNAGFVVTNYAYWMTVNDRANGIERSGEDAEMNGENPVELLVLDEAHAAVEQLAGYLGFVLEEKDVRNYTADPKHLTDSWKDWKSLALEAKEDLTGEIRTTGMELAHLGGKATQAQVRILHELEERLVRFDRISTMGDDWVLDAQIGTRMGRTWRFDVVWPGRYNHYLFCGVPKVVEMSATLNRKDLGLQGLGGDRYEFKEWRRIFPVQNCPIYYYPAVKNGEEGKLAAIRVTNKAGHEDKLAWVRHMDGIIKSRLDRRIVIITSSYAYQRFIMEESQFSRYMMGNTGEREGGTAAENFDEFIRTEPPVILCSPSFGTGWDFEGERCEVLILSKVPLRVPGGASKIMAARLERDGEYGDNETMRDVVQAAGRPQRGEKDTAEVFFVDGSWGWFGWKNKHLAPSGFVRDVRSVNVLPPAPVRIRDRRAKQTKITG